MSLGRITLVWVDILVCCPVELSGTSPVREIGFCGVGVQRSSYLTCSSWRSASELAVLWNSCGTVGQRFLLDRMLCLVALVLFQRNSGV